MKLISLLTILLCSTSLHSAVCIKVGILSHFNSLGHSGSFYGNETFKGVKKAEKEFKSNCYKVKKYDIGENLLTLKKAFSKIKDTQYFIGLGSSNKVKAVLPILSDKLLISPTATSNEFIGNKNVFMTAGTNTSIAKSISNYLNKNFTIANIIYDPKDSYSINLMETIKKSSSIKLVITSKQKDLSTKAGVTLILLNEIQSSAVIQYIDKEKISKTVLGADIWGPKTIYVKKALSKTKYLISAKRFHTYKHKNGFDTDIMYYSYLSFKYLDQIITLCKKDKKSTCLASLKTEVKKNFINWDIEYEEIL